VADSLSARTQRKMPPEGRFSYFFASACFVLALHQLQNFANSILRVTSFLFFELQ
jgi:hypothetical protein